jgi:hypothetical protein
VLRQSGPAAAVFLIENGTPRTLAALGDPAPGGGSFAALASWPVISKAGKVAFVASLDGGPNGLAIFVSDGDALRRLAAVGDPLPDGGRIAAFPLYPTIAITADDSVTFSATAEREGMRRDTIFYYGPPRRLGH